MSKTKATHTLFTLFAACFCSIAPCCAEAVATTDENMATAQIPAGEEVYVTLAPNWSNYGQYLWTSDGETAGIVRFDAEHADNIDFAAAAFIKVPTDDPARFKFYHIASRRYLYGLNYIAQSPDSDPLDIYDGDPWSNRCVLTADAEAAHALLLIDDYTYSTHTRVIDYKAKGWTVIQDPVEDHPGDGCNYYGAEYGYCVYSLYRSTGNELGGFGAVICGPDYNYYSADPWIIRTPQELAAHLGLSSIDSQLPVGVRPASASEQASASAVYDLSGRNAKASAALPGTLMIDAGRKVLARDGK